jgi:adenylate kinase
MRLLIMGPQGVGKGTQAERLCAHYSITHIATGDIFRANIKGGTQLGKQAQAYINKGQLVPDELTNKLVEDRLGQKDVEGGWILDGYPRNAGQVAALDEMLERLGTPLDAVVALEADRDVLLERMAKRAQIEGRSDDNPETIKARLAVYEKETKPLLDTYEKRGLLVRINGVGSIESITDDIIAHLDARTK